MRRAHRRGRAAVRRAAAQPFCRRRDDPLVPPRLRSLQAAGSLSWRPSKPAPGPSPTRSGSRPWLGPALLIAACLGSTAPSGLLPGGPSAAPAARRSTREPGAFRSSSTRTAASRPRVSSTRGAPRPTSRPPTSSIASGGSPPRSERRTCQAFRASYRARAGRVRRPPSNSWNTRAPTSALDQPDCGEYFSHQSGWSCGRCSCAPPGRTPFDEQPFSGSSEARIGRGISMLTNEQAACCMASTTAGRDP